MVEKVRVIEKMLGRGKRLHIYLDIEKKEIFRKSMVTKYDLPKCHTISLDDLDLVRPGMGLRLGNEDGVKEKKLKYSICAEL